MSIGGPVSRTHRSVWIAGVCRTVPIKNTGPIPIDLIEDLGSESETIAKRGPLTRGCPTLGAIRKCPRTRSGASVSTRAATGGIARDGAATGGVAKGGATTDLATTGGQQGIWHQGVGQLEVVEQHLWQIEVVEQQL